MTKATGIRDRWEIEELKAAWRADPSFDLCAAEGFEAHRDELARWEDECNARWERELKWQRKAAVRARMTKFPCSRELAEYLVELEETIASLRLAVRNLEHPGLPVSASRPWRPRLGLVARV